MDRQSIRALVEGTKATLDGKPAVVIGFANDFATVATLDNTMRVEYAWPTVVRIIQNNDARFRS